MEFNNKIPEWKNEGSEPSSSRLEEGFKLGYKPPAGIFNWFWSKVSKAITELQTKFGNHAENNNNPHGVTATQVGLGNVNNTADSEKSVKFASEAGTGRKVANALSIRFKGGNTEGTDKWTFDGSTGKSVNITPKNIGAAAEIHTHVTEDITDFRNAVDKIITATSTDGISYTATVDGITELYNGLQITIIPNKRSASRTISLNVNGLGAVAVRQPLSFSTFVATAPDRDYFLYENTPCRLMYHANYANGGIWLMADKQKTSAQDLYGNVPIENGGTGASNASDAIKNLGINNPIWKTYIVYFYDNVQYLGGLPNGKTILDICIAIVEYSNDGFHESVVGVGQYLDANSNDRLMCVHGTGYGKFAYGTIQFFMDEDEGDLCIKTDIGWFDVNTGANTFIEANQIESVKLLYI